MQIHIYYVFNAIGRAHRPTYRQIYYIHSHLLLPQISFVLLFDLISFLFTTTLNHRNESNSAQV